MRYIEMYIILKKRINLSPWIGITLLIISIILTPSYSFHFSNLGNEVYKIIYIHVPSAWLSLLTYLILGIFSLIFLVTKNPFLLLWSLSIALIGSFFTFITLVTGSLWAKPTWGTYWVWDARLTSVLLLFFFFLGYLILRSRHFSLEASYLCILGLINLPIIKFCVQWWSGLHQSSSLSSFGSSIHFSLLFPLFFWFLTFFAFSLSLFFLLSRGFLLSSFITTSL